MLWLDVLISFLAQIKKLLNLSRVTANKQTHSKIGARLDNWCSTLQLENPVNQLQFNTWSVDCWLAWICLKCWYGNIFSRFNPLIDNEKITA